MYGESRGNCLPVIGLPACLLWQWCHMEYWHHLHNRLFLYFVIFLPNHGRLLPALTCNGLQPLYVNASRILPGFGRKLGNTGKLECQHPNHVHSMREGNVFTCHFLFMLPETVDPPLLSDQELLTLRHLARTGLAWSPILKFWSVRTGGWSVYFLLEYFLVYMNFTERLLD